MVFYAKKKKKSIKKKKNKPEVTLRKQYPTYVGGLSTIPPPPYPICLGWGFVVVVVVIIIFRIIITTFYFYYKCYSLYIFNYLIDFS